MSAKKSIGWHIAGIILAFLLLIVSAVTLCLGIYAFGTADYPAVGGYAVYPVRSEIVPPGAAVVADADAVPQRGVPVAYMDAEQEHICVKYYYGEEDGVIILMDADGGNVQEISPSALRGVAVSTVRYLGAVLAWGCSLAGVCISLAAAMLMIFAVILICAAVIRRIRHNRELPSYIEDDFLETSEKTAEAPQEEVIEEVRITEHISMKRLAADENGRIRVLFYGNVTAILKLAQLIRTLAEKKKADSVTVEERYDDYCGLCVELEEKDLPLIRSIVSLLQEREEQKPMSYMLDDAAEEQKNAE